MIKQQLHTLLTKEMDRKNFLQYCGGVFLGLIGVTGLIRILLSTNQSTSSRADKPSGYGSSSYGS